jgi:hypothetical protein
VRKPAAKVQVAAADFLAARLKGVPVEAFDEACERALVALLASDVTLDQSLRRLLAAELEWLYRSPSRRQQQKRKRAAGSKAIEALKDHLQNNKGMKALEAEMEIAEALGTTFGALRKRVQRARD